MTHDTRHRLLQLLDLLVDDQATPEQIAQIEELVLADRDAQSLYFDYLCLHGNLAWDAALGVASPEPVPAVAQTAGWRRSRLVRAGATVASAAAVLLAVLLVRPAGVLGPAPVAIDTPNPKTNRPGTPDPAGDGSSGTAKVIPSVPMIPPIHIAGANTPATTSNPPSAPETVSPPATPAVRTDVVSVVGLIDTHLNAGWTLSGVTPSKRADDAEWVRRVYLDIAGHIPDVAAVDAFLADRREDRRERLVNELLAGSDFARHFATQWTNLLVGRSSNKPVDRVSLARFLRRQFHENRPWSETVGQLLTAEGTEQENGASAFLLAHLNNEAVPATAITSRLFLCTQMHCMQCHKHPTTGASQDEFWGFNSFFQQTSVAERDEVNPQTGQRQKVRALVNDPSGSGPTFYEDLRGVVRVAYPKLESHEVDSRAGVNRRQELARLLADGDRPQLARAMVNRMWNHFFGRGFTTPVDDMGPHTPVSHPELLDELTAAFVASGYDVQQLIRWICTSSAYQLTSEFGTDNQADEPSEGVTPLFSRMYVKPLSAEQMFDSLLVATNAHRSVSWNEVETRRQAWLDQFYAAVDNDENAEVSTFDGSFAQTLMMMNGDLIRQAVSGQPGTSLYEVLNEPGGEAEKIRRLCQTALSRQPTPRELSRLVELVRKYRKEGRQPVEVALNEGLSDVLWAYLNSSEFAVNH